MKTVFIVALLIAVAIAAPLDDPQNAQILKYENDNIGIDGYNFAYETSDGTSQSEQGQLKNIGTDNEALSVKGSYKFTGKDGVEYKVNYIADENGFQPQGAHLPKA